MGEMRRLSLEPDPRALRVARDAVAALGPAIPNDVVDRARLVLGELVANSIRHGRLRPGERIDVTIELMPDRLRCTVVDPGHGLNRAADAWWFAERAGWGLRMTEALASRWSVERRRGTEAWFEIDVPSGGEGAA
jgi:anti-sigma regulatory factor (Ser/Thr protein kinase)